MINYLFLGDTHGDLDFVQEAAKLAAEHEATIIQVGDWGFLWPSQNQLPHLEKVLAMYGVTMRFIDGNHDDHPALKQKTTEALFKPMPPGGGFALTDHVVYHPRGAGFEDTDGTRFLFCGGAPSIDKWNRTEGRSWWPEEVISVENYNSCINMTGPFHVLVTHDAPDYPPGYSPAGEPAFREQSRDSMEKIRNLIEHHRPDIHVHGHWHYRYSTVHNNGTITYGLGSNFHFSDATMLWSRKFI